MLVISHFPAGNSLIDFTRAAKYTWLNQYGTSNTIALIGFCDLDFDNAVRMGKIHHADVS
jgi:hypothetical protein